MPLNVESAILSHNDEQGLDHPFAYFICKLLPSLKEENYSAIEKECLAIELRFWSIGGLLYWKYDYSSDWSSSTKVVGSL